MDELGEILASHPAVAAPELLGLSLIVDGVATVITEVEAYGGVGEDPASHAFRRATPRNQVMFQKPGSLYVYFTYGMHWCANIVAHEIGQAGAVLIRATRDAQGPARICKRFEITGADNGIDLLDSASRVRIAGPRIPGNVASSPRTGISGEGAPTPWRFYLLGESISPYRAGRQRGSASIRQDDPS